MQGTRCRPSDRLPALRLQRGCRRLHSRLPVVRTTYPRQRKHKRVFMWKLTGRSPHDGKLVVIGRYDEREREFAEREVETYREQGYKAVKLQLIKAE